MLGLPELLPPGTQLAALGGSSPESSARSRNIALRQRGTVGKRDFPEPGQPQLVLLQENVTGTKRVSSWFVSGLLSSSPCILECFPSPLSLKLCSETFYLHGYNELITLPYAFPNNPSILIGWWELDVRCQAQPSRWNAGSSREGQGNTEGRRNSGECRMRTMPNKPALPRDCSQPSQKSSFHSLLSRTVTFCFGQRCPWETLICFFVLGVFFILVFVSGMVLF